MITDVAFAETSIGDYAGAWALSIRQPYAWAIAAGHKPIENRTWRTRYRGAILIHAGLQEDIDGVGDVIDLVSDQTGEAPGAVLNDYMLRRRLGGIVGRAFLQDCRDHHDSAWFSGPWAFVLRDAKHVPFARCPGKLGLFVVPTGLPPSNLFTAAGMIP